MIRSKAGTIMLDCGVPATSIRKAGIRLADLDGCLISHEHGDHVSAWRHLVRAHVQLYMSEGTAKALNTFDGYRIADGVPLKVGGFRVLPLKMFHDSAEPLGFFIVDNISKTRLLYTSDTGAIPYNLVALTHIMLEVNHSEELLKSEDSERVKANHLSLESALEFLSRQDLSAVREIRLCHLSDRNSDAKLFVDTIKAATGRPVVAV